MHTVGPRVFLTADAKSPRRERSEMSSTTTTSAASISFAARSERSAPLGTRKSKRDGIGVGLTITGARRRAVSRCHSATSLPTPSPSAFTCVVKATLRPGVSTAAISCAPRTRSGGMGTVMHKTTSRKGVEENRQEEALREYVARYASPSTFLFNASPRHLWQ